MLESRRHHWLIASSAGVALAVCGLSLAACGGSSPSTNKSAQQLQIFSADVRTGPDSGMSVWGVLRLGILRSGQVTGALAPGGGGQRLTVSGAVAGRSLELVFHLPGGRLMTGVGTASRKGPTATGAVILSTKGTLTGPRAGDRGDWIDQTLAAYLLGQYERIAINGTQLNCNSVMVCTPFP